MIHKHLPTCQLILVIAIWMAPLSSQSCRYHHGLDLSPLQGLNIQCSFEEYFMLFTPCQGNLQCNVFDLNRYMTIQNTLSGACQAGIAQFDESVQPTRTTIDGQTAFTFDLANGQMSFDCEDPRSLSLTFICDPDAKPYAESRVDCGEDSGSICAYFMRVYTNAA